MMTKTLEDAGTTGRTRLKQIVANSFGSVLGTLETYVAFVRFSRTFGKRLRSSTSIPRTCTN